MLYGKQNHVFNNIFVSCLFFYPLPALVLVLVPVIVLEPDVPSIPTILDLPEGHGGALRFPGSWVLL